MDERMVTERFDGNIRQTFRDALRISLRNPAMASFLYRAMARQGRALKTRRAWAERGVRVPPFMIASITKRCNLRCKGCYAQAQHRPDAEMSPARLRRLIAEADELGISFVLVAGGEPLTRPEILDIAAEHPGIIFPLFTNGTLLDEALLARLRDMRNIVPVISLEGYAWQTDARRGAGVSAHAEQIMGRMGQEGLFYGTSLTVTRDNLDTVTSPEFVGAAVARGCRVFFYVDYVPVQPGTECLTLTEEQRATEAARLAELRARYGALFIAFPGDEEQYGGCLAAGRGFVHVSPEGSVEPCPFSPFSDTNLKEGTLLEALQSGLLRTIREHGDELQETAGGCALWQKRDWVASLLAEPVAEAVA